MMTPAVRAPFLRGSESTLSRMRDVLIAFVPALIAGCYFCGLSVLLAFSCALAAAAASETLFSLVLRRRIRLADGSFAVTALLCTLLMPASAPFWCAAAAAAIAALCKAAFGGIGRNWLNPALCGVIIVYAAQLAVPASLLETLLPGRLPEIHLADLIFGGNRWGCIGMSSPLLLVLGYGYLLARGIARPCFSLSFLSVLAIGTEILLRVYGPGVGVLFGLCSGEALLIALFCGSDSVTTPMHPIAQLVLGLLAGGITLAMRHILGIEGAGAAMILINLLSRGADALFVRRQIIKTK